MHVNDYNINVPGKWRHHRRHQQLSVPVQPRNTPLEMILAIRIHWQKYQHYLWFLSVIRTSLVPFSHPRPDCKTDSKYIYVTSVLSSLSKMVCTPPSLTRSADQLLPKCTCEDRNSSRVSAYQSHLTFSDFAWLSLLSRGYESSRKSFEKKNVIDSSKL